MIEVAERVTQIAPRLPPVLCTCGLQPQAATLPPQSLADGKARAQARRGLIVQVAPVVALQTGNVVETVVVQATAGQIGAQIGHRRGHHLAPAQAQRLTVGLPLPGLVCT
ncbi:hypothetical protein D3C79_718660 [compost metagenome]